MANPSGLFRKLEAIKNSEQLLEKLDREIDLFIKKTERFVFKKISLELDSEKIEEAISKLNELEKKVKDYRKDVRRFSRIKVKQREGTYVHGRVGNLRGQSRKIEKKLDRLLQHVDRLRTNFRVFKMSPKAVGREMILKQVDNFIDYQKGEFKHEGDITVAITFLLYFFTEFLKRK